MMGSSAHRWDAGIPVVASIIKTKSPLGNQGALETEVGDRGRRIRRRCGLFALLPAGGIFR